MCYQIICYSQRGDRCVLFQFDDITPPCRGVFRFEVVLDGIGEDVGFAFAILLGVLLAADDDGLGGSRGRFS